MMQELWIPGPLPGANEIVAAAKRPAWSKTCYTKLKKQWTEDVWKLARNARLKSADGPVDMHFIWREKNRKRDIDNVSAGVKFVLDGLVLAGVLENDGWEHVASIEHRFQVDLRNPGVLVHISPACPF